MTYEEFIDFVKSKCTYETIYEDSEGRLILVIDLLGAYGMVNKVKRPWVGLRAEEIEKIQDAVFGVEPHYVALARTVEAKLKEKNA